MRPTSDQLLSQIDRHLRKDNWLLNEELIAELTDHYVAAIDSDLQRGLPVEQAIQAIHADFGGRKGLLAMEELYQKSQAKQFSRQVKNRFISYFRFPRLGITFLFFILSYCLIRLWPLLIATSFWEHDWALVALGGLGITYVFAYVQMLTGAHKRWAANARGQLMWVLFQTMNVAVVTVPLINTFVPIDQLADTYPMLASMSGMLLMVVEAAVSELLFERFIKSHNNQLA